MWASVWTWIKTVAVPWEKKLENQKTVEDLAKKAEEMLKNKK
jgi:hypothetical protein